MSSLPTLEVPRPVLPAMRAYVLAHLPRVLTHLDRDPDSPTFGCFDRAFWHYKTQDFSSAILQQSVLMLDAAAHSEFLPEPDRKQLRRWAQAALDFWASLPTSKGGFNEYYPFEGGYPPTGFSLHAVAFVLPRYQTSPAINAQVQRAVDYLLRHFESEALNQQAAGLAALALCRKLPGIAVDESQFASVADRFFAAQNPEGWFPEYGGPDIGYLSVTIDMLWDYFDATGDPRATKAIEKAIEFTSWFVAPDGSLAGLCNSRNTDYAVPYGFSRAGRQNALAAEVTRRLFGHLEEPRHFLASVDDRYHLHYIFNSCIRSLKHLPLLNPAQQPLPCDGAERKFFAGCGNLAVHHGGEYSFFFAGKKGGAVKLVTPGSRNTADYGWRCRVSGQLYVSNFWNDAYQVTCPAEGDSIEVQGPLVAVAWHRPSPLRHLLVRAASFFLGKKLIPILKRLLIFRHAGGSVHLARKLDLSRPHELQDTLMSSGPITAWRAERPSARHVSSAGSFAWEELNPPAAEKLEGNGSLTTSRPLTTTSPG